MSYPIQPKADTNIGYTKSYTNPSQSNLLSSYIQIIIPYGSNTLPLSQFSHPFSLFLVHKIIPTIPTNTLFLYNSAIFHLPLFVYNHPNNLHQKYYPYLKTFCEFSLRQGTRELGSIVMTDTDTFNISQQSSLTTTDFLSLRLKTLMYCRRGKPSNQPSLIHSTYFHYFHI